MKKAGFTCLIILGFMITDLTVHAQTKEQKKYDLRASEVEEEIRGTADPFFAVNAVPGTYNNSSAVVLAKKIDIFSDLTSNVKRSLFYGTSVTNNIRYAMTIREKVKIQDKNALNEYSEFTFSKISGQSSFSSKAAYTFIGIVVIKPDGKEKKIDIDEEAVNTQDDEGRQQFKIAIPGLQVGDIIDIYSRFEKEGKTDNSIEPLDLVIGGDYPVLNYALRAKIRKDFAVIFSVNNGATAPKETRDNDFIFLNSDYTNINTRPETMWMYDRRELPVFRMNIVPVGKSISKKASSVKKAGTLERGQVLNGLSKEWVDNELSTMLNEFSMLGNSGTALDYAIMYIKKLKKERNLKEIPRDTLINHLYYYGRFVYLYDYMSESSIQVGLDRNSASTNYNFYGYLIAAFRYFDIDYDFLFTLPRSAGALSSVVSKDDFLFLLRAKGNSEYYLFPPNMFSISNSFPPLFEGQEAYVFKSTSINNKGGKSEIEKLPFTKPAFNQSLHKLDISFDPENPLVLNINRTVSLSGNGAYENQVRLTLFEEYVDSERKRFGERKFKDEIIARVGSRKGPVLIDEYKNVFREAKEKREELAKQEVENEFNTKPVRFSDFKVISTGNRHDQREFSFKEKIALDGILKKAGQNYILTLDKIFSGQVQVKKEQRERKANIHMPYARSFITRISFAIPQGYTIEGIQTLNKNVENETGKFSSKASFEGGKLEITVEKIYNHYYEPAANWNKMLEFLDAAYDFSQLKLLIKKQ